MKQEVKNCFVSLFAIVAILAPGLSHSALDGVSIDFHESKVEEVRYSTNKWTYDRKATQIVFYKSAGVLDSMKSALDISEPLIQLKLRFAEEDPTHLIYANATLSPTGDLERLDDLDFAAKEKDGGDLFRYPSYDDAFVQWVNYSIPMNLRLTPEEVQSLFTANKVIIHIQEVDSRLQLRVTWPGLAEDSLLLVEDLEFY